MSHPKTYTPSKDTTACVGCLGSMPSPDEWLYKVLLSRGEFAALCSAFGIVDELPRYDPALRPVAEWIADNNKARNERASYSEWGT